MAVTLITNPTRYTVLSTDTKPATANAGDLVRELDTGVVYVWNGSAWVVSPRGATLWP